MFCAFTHADMLGKPCATAIAGAGAGSLHRRRISFRLPQRVGCRTNHRSARRRRRTQGEDSRRRGVGRLPDVRSGRACVRDRCCVRSFSGEGSWRHSLVLDAGKLVTPVRRMCGVYDAALATRKTGACGHDTGQLTRAGPGWDTLKAARVADEARPNRLHDQTGDDGCGNRCLPKPESLKEDGCEFVSPCPRRMQRLG